MSIGQSKIQGQVELSSLSGSYHLTLGSTEDLILMVHGKAGNRQVMKIFEKSFPSEANFIYPEADLPDPLGGFSWWLDSNNSNFTIAADKLSLFLEETIAKFELRPKRIIACGFSQGGACLSWLAQSKEGLFSHLIMICSFYLQQTNQLSVYPNTFIYHGLSDQVVNVSEAVKAVEFLTARQASVTLVSDLQGHKISSKGMKSLKDWILTYITQQ